MGMKCRLVKGHSLRGAGNRVLQHRGLKDVEVLV